MSFSLLIVEDDPQIQRIMAIFLRKEGYQVTAVSTGEAALTLLAENPYDLVLLDMMLPGIGGEQVLDHIRQTNPQQPVMIISALDDEYIQIDAFTKQIEDYVIKPFSMNILSFKIKTILYRIYGKPDRALTIGDLSIVPEAYQVFRGDEELPLTTKEFELLLTMAENQGRVYSREELLTLVWGYDFFGDSRTIDVHIKNIRQKIGKDAIKTIKGVGYKV